MKKKWDSKLHHNFLVEHIKLSYHNIRKIKIVSLRMEIFLYISKTRKRSYNIIVTEFQIEKTKRNRRNTKQNRSLDSNKSLESWIWDAACSIRGVQDAPRYKDYILPLIFVERLCDVYEDEIDRISKKVGNRSKAFKLIERDKSLVRFYIPIKLDDPEKESTWSVIRTLSDKIGDLQQVLEN